MNTAAFQQLMVEPTEELLNLVYDAQLFHHLKIAGVFSGLNGMLDASKRNQRIKQRQRDLDLTSRELTLLVNKHGTNPFVMRT